MAKNCKTNKGRSAFQNLPRRATPVAAYITENEPMSNTEAANRVTGWRPMLITSSAKPIPTKTKKTARRKMTLDLSGVVRHDPGVFIDPCVLLELENRTGVFRCSGVDFDWI